MRLVKIFFIIYKMKLPEASSRNLGILFAVPAVGIITGAIAPVNRVNQYAILRIRPAPWVFGVAWLILYFLVGFAWMYALSSETQLSDWYRREQTKFAPERSSASKDTAEPYLRGFTWEAIANQIKDLIVM